MESNNINHNEEQNAQREMKLKHLKFVRVAAINTIICLTSVYKYAKQNSGPLKSAVDSVEGAVTTVVTPVFDRFKDFPDHVLAFLDQKVDVASAKFDEHAPPLAKQVATQVHFMIDQTTQLAKEIIHQAQTGGPLAAAQYAADESKELVLEQSLKVWSKIDQFQPFHMMAEIVIPTAAHWSEKYNNVITNLRENGHAVFSYVPLVPLDEISKAFKQSEGANEGDVANSSNGEAVASQ